MPNDLTIRAAQSVSGGTVTCIFARWVKGEGTTVSEASVYVTSGLAPWRRRLQEAAHRYAKSGGWSLWAMPALVHDAPGDWIIVRAAGASDVDPDFVKRLPTREAAEMWMIHAGF